MFMLAAALLVIRSQTARAIDMGRLQQQLSAGRSKVSALSGVVGGYSGRLDRLNASIDKLQSRLDAKV